MYNSNINQLRKAAGKDYASFEDLQALIDALEAENTALKERIKYYEEIAEEHYQLFTTLETRYGEPR